jgi:hypothetical protein
MARAMDPQGKSRLKAKLVRLLTAGAGSLVVATTVMSTPAAALVKPSADPLVERAAQARAKLIAGDPAAEESQAPHLELAWWRNWGNGGFRPRWPNWPNWRNWSNWRNF